MTKDERVILTRIEEKVLECCLKITALVEKHDDVDSRVRKVEFDLYGNAEDRETNPGLLAQVSDLRKSRRIARLVAGGLWTLATLAIGGLITMVVT